MNRSIGQPAENKKHFQNHEKKQIEILLKIKEQFTNCQNLYKSIKVNNRPTIDRSIDESIETNREADLYIGKSADWPIGESANRHMKFYRNQQKFRKSMTHLLKCLWKSKKIKKLVRMY